MVATPEIQAPQGGLIGVIRQSASELRTPQSFPIVIYNVPADQIQTTFGGSNVVFSQDSQQMKATQAQLIVVGRGRIDTPKLRSWSFTLDGHDFYVLKLGTYRKTLVLDITTGQFSWWATDPLVTWRANIGFNWRSAGNIPEIYGSNILVGDDSYGALWVLDPEQGYDNRLLRDDPNPFERVATGQIPHRGRAGAPVFSVYLTASLGQPAFEGASVTLRYSDNQGNDYVSAGDRTIVEGDYSKELVWRSLGRIPAPGRLFQIKDNGAFARIDSLDVNIE
jgi:hypothetical protein